MYNFLSAHVTENKDPEKSIGRIKMDSGASVEGNLKPSLADVDSAVKSAGIKIISSSDSPRYCITNTFSKQYLALLLAPDAKFDC